MANIEEETDLLVLLNKALARELQVSIQYMLQHATLYAQESAPPDKKASKKRDKFVSDHSLFRGSLATLKKIAITEMKHAEAIAERIVCLEGEPTTKPDHITLGNTARDILMINRKAEQGAIVLYKHIIDVAGKENDDLTKDMFKRILPEEENHLKRFSSLLEAE